jgi:hypothetical protein
MGKRNSTAAGTATGAAAKRAKTADADAPAVGNWVQTKVQEKDLQSAEKIGILKNDPVETLAAGPEIIPRPPTGFRVLFLAFILQGLSFPPLPFLRGLLFAYGIQLHDLNPNTILHIACFVTLCECFLGIKPHWALWHRIFVIRRPLALPDWRLQLPGMPRCRLFQPPDDGKQSRVEDEVVLCQG